MSNHIFIATLKPIEDLTYVFENELATRTVISNRSVTTFVKY